MVAPMRNSAKNSTHERGWGEGEQYTPMHLYIHIPFCRQRCTYCDYVTYAAMEHRIAAYVQAVCAEIACLPSSSNLFASPDLRPSLFIGGGTPSMLSLHQFEHILHAASAVIPLDKAEITIEANPGTLMGGTHGSQTAQAYLHGLRAIGINRLSLGVQSLHDPLLQRLGRIHTAAEAQACFEHARCAGFASINLDLIYGLPGQSRAMWQDTLHTARSWNPDHLSLYSLILEPRSPLFAQVAAGAVHLPDDDESALMYELAQQHLADAGYVQYEISNWTRRSYCHHNLAYWYNDDYLAVGAGAHGHVYPERYANVAEIERYIALVVHGQRPVAEVLALTPQDLCAETMFMGLRMTNGVSFERFARRCGLGMQQVYGSVLAELEAADLLVCDDVGVRLTAHGRMFGNRVFERFA